MGLIEKLENKKVFLDTAPLIYFIEPSSKFQNELLKAFELNNYGKLLFQTFVLTLLEVLVQPIKLGRKDLVDQYSQILMNSSHIEIFNIDIGVAKKAAELRAKYCIKTPDSIQIATGIIHGSEVFLTNDKDLMRITEITVLTLGGVIDS